MDEDFRKNENPKHIRKISRVGNKKNKETPEQSVTLGGKYEVRPLQNGEREKFEKGSVQEHYKGKYNEKALSEINKVQFEANPPKSYKGKYEKGVVDKEVYSGKYSIDDKKPESHALEIGNSFETYNGRYSADNIPENESDKRIRGIKKLPEISVPDKKKKKEKKKKEEKKVEKNKERKPEKKKKSAPPEQVKKSPKKKRKKKKEKFSVE